jgi:hypothetical protein
MTHYERRGKNNKEKTLEEPGEQPYIYRDKNIVVGI